MNDVKTILFSVFVMALTTYLIRCLPMVLFRKKITDRTVRSFLYYVPFAVLAAMTIPAIFTSTGMLISAVTGLLAAMVIAYHGGSLITVAMCSCAVVFITETLIHLF